MSLEDRVEELEGDIEELQDKVERMENFSEDEEEKENPRTLYLYITYIYKTTTGLFGQRHKKKILIEEREGEADGYTIPHAPVAENASTTRQAINMLQSKGVDAWDSIERVGENEDGVYYQAEIPDGAVECADCGYWVDRHDAESLITEWEAVKYL
jgi:hypothetical protein